MSPDLTLKCQCLLTQVAVNAHAWLDQKDRWNRIKLVVSEDDCRKGYQRAMHSMARLNSMAAKMMHKYNAHGASDVSGYVYYDFDSVAVWRCKTFIRISIEVCC